MKLCVPIPCFFPKGSDFCEAIDAIADLGFDTAEIYGWKDLDLSAAKAALDRRGVSLISMCTTEFRMTDPQYRDLWLAGLSESCEAAAKVGARFLISQVGPDTGAPREEQHASIVAACRAAIPILEKYEITLMLEPLNTYVDHPGYYLTTAAEAFAIVREVGHPLVRIVFDIYHQQVMEGNIIPNITKNLDCIAHLHAAGHPGRIELQYGESDYKNIFAAAERAGYTGACGLEYHPTLPPLESLALAKKLYGDA